MPSVILAGTTTGTALSLTSDTSGELQIQTNNGSTTAMTLTTGGNVLIGLNTARTAFFNGTNTPLVQVEGTTFNASSQSIVRNSADTAPPFLVFGKTRGTAVGSTTAAASGDQLGTLSFQGSDGTELVEAARILVLVDGTPGANDMPGALAFNTTADGAASSTERMRIDSAGNVGIGTASPSTYGQVVAFGNGFAAACGAGTTSAKFEVFSNGQTNNQISLSQGFGGLDNIGYLYNRANAAFVFGTNNAERMRIDSSGFVGININYGLARLTVAGSIASGNGAYATFPGTIMISESDLTSLQQTGGIEFKASVFGAGYGAKILGADNGSLLFGNRANSATWSERMRIDLNGNLLVGTTSAYLTSILSLQSANSNNARITQNIYNSAATSTTRLQNTLLRVSSNANGADTCLQLTDNVANNYFFGGNNGGAYVVTNSGGVRLSSGGTSWASDSDERVKDIIEPITDATNKVATLRAVIGKYKTDDKGKRRVFLIAQDVQAVLPEAVFDENGTLMLAYTDTIPLLVAAIKEQQAMIETLTTRLNALEGK